MIYIQYNWCKWIYLCAFFLAVLLPGIVFLTVVLVTCCYIYYCYASSKAFSFALFVVDDLVKVSPLISYAFLKNGNSVIWVELFESCCLTLLEWNAGVLTCRPWYWFQRESWLNRFKWLRQSSANHPRSATPVCMVERPKDRRYETWREVTLLTCFSLYCTEC